MCAYLDERSSGPESFRPGYAIDCEMGVPGLPATDTDAPLYELLDGDVRLFRTCFANELGVDLEDAELDYVFGRKV